MKKYLWPILVLFFLNGCAGAQLAIGVLQTVAELTDDSGINKESSAPIFVLISNVIEEHTINNRVIVVGEGLCGLQTHDIYNAKILSEKTNTDNTDNYVCYDERSPERMLAFNNFLKMPDYEKKVYLIETFKTFANFDLGPMPSDPKIATPNISNPLVQPTSQPIQTPESKSLSSNF